jgi:hypothetical protein
VLKTAFEEKVDLFHAPDFDDAIAKAEAYCGTSGDTVYLGLVDAYHLFEDTVGHATDLLAHARERPL